MINTPVTATTRKCHGQGKVAGAMATGRGHNRLILAKFGVLMCRGRDTCLVAAVTVSQLQNINFQPSNQSGFDLCLYINVVRVLLNKIEHQRQQG